MSAGSSTITRRWSGSTRSFRAIAHPRTEALALALLLSACSSPAETPDGSAVWPDGGSDLVAALEQGPGLDRGEGGTPSDRCAPSSALVAKVSAPRLLADLNALVGLKERRTAAGQAAALAYLKEQLAPLPGLTLRDHTYSYKGASYVNLEVSIAGEDAGAPIVMAGGHYDSIALDNPSNAPGADDNASGTSALLEAARVLAGCRPKRGVKLLFFSNEEVGTVGSMAYVASIKSSLPPEKVVGFLAVDTIGFGPAGEDLDLATKPAQKPFADAVKSAVEAWTSLKVKEVINDHCG